VNGDLEPLDLQYAVARILGDGGHGCELAIKGGDALNVRHEHDPCRCGKGRHRVIVRDASVPIMNSSSALSLGRGRRASARG
jgi:hypothetical protein